MSELKSTYSNENIEPFYVGGTSAAISHDGGILATPNYEEVVITNLDTSETIAKLEGDGELITNLTLSPDGSRLAIISQSQQLRIYDLHQEEMVKTVRLSSPVYISTSDSTSTLFAFGGTDGTITVWDIEGSYITHTLKGHNTTISSLRFFGELNSSDWKLISGDIMGNVKVWDLVKRKAVVTTSEHNGAVRGLDMNDEYLVTGGRDEILVIYKVDNLKKPWKMFPIRQQIENCGFIEVDGKLVVYSAGAGNLLQTWDIHSGKLLGKSTETLQTNEELVIIDVVKLEESLMMVISDQTLVEVALEAEHGNDEVYEMPVVRRIAGNHGTIADMKFVGPNFDLIALATNSPSLRIVDESRPVELKIYEGHTDLLNALDVSSNGEWLVTGSKDHSAILWHWSEQLDDFELFCKFIGHAGSVSAVKLSNNEGKPNILVTASNDLTIKKWKIPAGPGEVKTSEYTRRGHEKEINAIDISPNDEHLATASYDKLGKIWNIDTGETIGILKGHKRGLWDINFCKYDKLLLTSSGDKTTKLWSLNDFSCMKTFEGHTNSVQRSKFINKNQQFVTSGADGLIKIWNIKTEECVKSYDNHLNRIWALDVKEDGDTIVSGDSEGQITVWHDNSEELMLQNELEQKNKIEQEQNLSNLINQKNWPNAFLLALTLNHSMRLYNIIKSCIEAKEDPESIIGSKALEQTIQTLNNDQLVFLFKKIRDWNLNFKHFEISQKVLRVLVNHINYDNFNLIKIIEAIIPYNERHLLRIDGLIEQSYILDYTIDQMS